MKKYTQKALKELIRLGAAQDVTNYDFERMDSFLSAHSIERVGISRGVYGMNGALLRDENGELYAITARNGALFQAV